ncbi:hypothetical protein D3C71_1532400 [compost metagenome]
MSIFNWLKNRSNNFSLATTSEQIPPYEEGFEQALRFTKSLGYNTTLLSLIDAETNLLDANGTFIDPVFYAAGIADRTQSGGQCLKWCHFLQPFFEKHIGKRVMLTIGQLWKNQHCLFGPTFEDVRRWNKSGLQLKDFEAGGGFKLHAWLTLESGEIIEPTLLSSLALAGHDSFKKYAGATVWGRDPSVLNGHRYVPIAVGNELIENIAERSAIPLLASNLSDLESIHAILITEVSSTRK